MAKGFKIQPRKGRKPDVMLPPYATHRARYMKHIRDGISLADIAKEEGVSVQYVKQSIGMMECYYQYHTEEELKAAQTEVILALTTLQRKTLEGALRATKRYYDEATGEFLREEPDYQVRLDAIAKINEKIDVIAPKGKGTQVNVGVGVGVNVKASGSPSGMFEDVLRRVQAQRAEYALNPPSPEPPMLEAQYEEPELIPEPAPEPEPVLVPVPEGPPPPVIEGEAKVEEPSGNPD
jgi:hypothetical protein